MIVLGLLFWFRRRKNQKSLTQTSGDYGQEGSILKKKRQQEPVELPAHPALWTPELHGDFSPASELDSDRGLSERGYSEHGHSEGTHSEFGQIESQMQRNPRG